MITPKKKPGRGGLLLLEPLPTVQVVSEVALKVGQRSFALLVGCGQFGAGLQPLPGALRDVTALYLRLSNGRCGYQSEDVKVLLNPTAQVFVFELQELVRTLAAAQSPFDSLLLYISTHGYYEAGEYRFCMSDAPSVRAERTEASLSFGWLRDTLAPLGSLSQIVMLDTCRVNEDQALTLTVQANEAPRREDLYLLGESWSIITSSSHGEVAWLEDASHVSGQGGPHSLFARVLLDELDSPGGGQDVLEVVALHKSLQQRLYELVQEVHPGVSQTPCLIANFQRQPVFARRQPNVSKDASPALFEPSAPEVTDTPDLPEARQPSLPLPTSHPPHLSHPSVGWIAPLVAVLLVLGGLGWLAVQRQASSAVVLETKTAPRQDRKGPVRALRSIPKSLETSASRKTPDTPPVATRQTAPVPRRRVVVAVIRHKRARRKRRTYRPRRTSRRGPRGPGAVARLVRKVLGPKWEPCHFRWGKALSFGRSCFPINKMHLLGKVASRQAYVKHFQLSRSAVSDEDLRHLAGFSDAQSLLLDRTQIDGSGLKALRHWGRLEVLQLAHSRFLSSNASLLRHFSGLVSLSLNNTYIDDQAMRYVGRLSRLQRLSLGDSNVRARGLVALGGLQRLTHLSICNRSPRQRRQESYGQHGGGADVPDQLLIRLPALRALRSLKLCRTSTSLRGVQSLLRRIGSFPNLRMLSLIATQVRDEEAAQLRRDCKAAGIRLHYVGRR